MARVRAAIRIDTDVQQDFVYLERRRDVKISALGKVSVAPPLTFEVFPSPDPARTYKRLVESDGKRLDPAELARRDAEHAADLEEQARKERRETPEQRARRLERTEAERRDRMAMLKDALAVFETALVGRETLEGEPAIVVTLTPRPDARVSTRQGNWMKQFTGRAWFVERDAQFAGFDMHATDDVSIGWGIVGRLHKGSRAGGAATPGRRHLAPLAPHLHRDRQDLDVPSVLAERDDGVFRLQAPVALRAAWPCERGLGLMAEG